MARGTEPLVSRRSIEIDTLRHRTPIPVATRIGPLIVSSVINAFEPGTRDLPESAERQAANVFRYVGQILVEAGADWPHVAKMEFWVPDATWRAALDTPWLEVFPDPASRPSRHTHLGGAGSVRASFIAYADP